MNASKEEPPRPKPGAPVGALALLAGGSAAVFAASLFLHADAERRETLAAELDREHTRALVASGDVQGALSHAWGAMLAAAEIVESGGSPTLAVQAAVRARPISGAALLDGTGSALASTSAAASELAIAARRAAGADPIWAGVATTERGASAPVLTRRIGGMLLVAALDPAQLLTGSHGAAITVLADAEGGALFATPSDAVARGADAATALGFADARAGAFFGEANGERRVVGRAAVQTAGLQVFTASPTDDEAGLWVETALGYALPALAPLAALAAMFAALRALGGRLRATRDHLTVAQDHLAVADERFRLASEGARAGIFEWRIDSDAITLSEQIVALLRASSGTLTTGQLAQIAPPDDRPAIEAAFDAARAGGPLDTSFRVAAGHSVVWIEMRGLPVEDAHGEVRIVGTALDVTARREAELRAQALQRRLREAIEGFSGPFALWDARRRLLMWNKSFQDLFRLPPTVLRPGAAYDAVSMACAAAIRREHSDPADPTSREVELTDGAWIKIQERRTGENGLLTIGVDVSAIKRQRDALAQSELTMKHAISKLELSEGRNRELARSFEEQKRRAEDASRAKSAFLANMSHELRTPLNAVIGFSEIMSSQLYGPMGDERYASYAKDIHASGQLLLDLINDVLDMAKIEAGKLNLSPRPLDPIDAVEQAVRLVRRRAEEKGLQLLVDAKDLPEIEADHRAVKQMLLNLLSNAVKFTDKGGILVEARSTKTGISLRVVDTGRGIPREHLHRLARPFEQVESDQARDQPGTGLGLALTKSLAEMHGGRLELESEEGRGTVVTILLPLRFGQSEDSIAAE